MSVDQVKDTLLILHPVVMNGHKKIVSHIKPQFWIALLLFMATFAVYGQVKDFDFVDFDDQMYVTQNPKIQAGLTIDGIEWAFSLKKIKSAAYWQPMTWVSHMLDVQLYGFNPGGHHLTNLLLHSFNAFLLFLVLYRATGNVCPSALAAGLFALHPLNVESVAWVAERKNVLSTFFWMLTMLAYVAYVKRPAFFGYMAVWLFFMLGLMAKPMLVTLPFVLLLMDYWPLRRIDFSPKGGDRKPDASKLKTFCNPQCTLRRLILEKIPLFLLTLLSIWISLFLVGSYGTIVSASHVPFDLRLKNALVTYIKYLGKAFWPQDLTVFYPYPETVPLAQVAGAIIFLVIISVWVFYHIKTKPYLAFGWFWFLGTLAPVMGMVQSGLWPEMADRWTYVPLIGLFVMIVWGISDLVTKFKFNPPYSVAGGIIILAALMAKTYGQVPYWQNSITLFQHTVNVTKNNAVFHSNLANVLMEKGKIDEAVFYYKAAIQLKPDSSEAHNNLGVAYTRQGEIKAAIEQFNEAIRIYPEYVAAYNNLGATFLRQGVPGEAMKYFRQALAIDPDNAETHNNLGMSFIRQGALDQAIYHFKESLRLDPNLTGAALNLKLSMELRKKIDTAIDRLEKALRPEPLTADSAGSLARIKIKREELESAVRHYQKTLSLQPGFTLHEFNMENYPKFFDIQQIYNLRLSSGRSDLRN